MARCSRFLLQFAWTSLGVVLAFAAVITAGCIATGVPDGAAYNLFATYFAGLPLTVVLILFILSFNLCGAYLQLALSLGARRRDYFFAVQVVLLLYTGSSWLLQLAVAWVPAAFAWANPERWSLLSALRGPFLFSYPLLCLAVLCLGCICGLIFVYSKALGVIMVFAAAVLGLFGTVFLFITSGTWDDSSWGILPVVLTAGAVAVVGVSEGFLWRTISRYAVK